MAQLRKDVALGKKIGGSSGMRAERSKKGGRDEASQSRLEQEGDPSS